VPKKVEQINDHLFNLRKYSPRQTGTLRRMRVHIPPEHSDILYVTLRFGERHEASGKPPFRALKTGFMQGSLRNCASGTGLRILNVGGARDGVLVFWTFGIFIVF